MIKGVENSYIKSKTMIVNKSKNKFIITKLDGVNFALTYSQIKELNELTNKIIVDEKDIHND